MTFKMFKDKGQGYTVNTFKSPYLYWLQGIGFDMYTYILNQRAQNVTRAIKVKGQSHKASAVK